MSHWKKEHDHDTDIITLSPKSRVPIYVVGSAMGLAIYGTVLYRNLSDQIKAAVTVEQAQTWIDNARDMNRVSNPSVVWPRLPVKTETMTKKEPSL